MSKNIVIVMLPESVLALQQEIAQFHPGLRMQLATDVDFYECIGTIAAHVGVALHGSYGGKDINDLCEILVKRLKEKRVITVNSENVSRILQ